MSEQKITISDLPELTGTVEDTYVLPIDDGEITKKVSVAHFEEAASATARQYAEAAADSATAAAGSAHDAEQTATEIASDIAAATQAANDARGAATRAAGSADAAAAADVQAQRSASSAATSANEATLSATEASGYKDTAQSAADRAKSWADYPGQAGSGSATNNAHFWADQARATVTGVASWNGRAGFVMPEDDDYNLSMLGDVSLSSSLANGASLEYKSSTSKWVNGSEKLRTDGGNSHRYFFFNAPTAVTIGTRRNDTPLGSASFGHGTNVAAGNNAYAQGYETKANGEYSHAEGNATIAVGDYSHAEGYNTEAGLYGHAEGDSTQAGHFDHAEGQSTIAEGEYSHAEGVSTKTNGIYSHAEGEGTEAKGSGSHAEGDHTVSTGSNSHTEGCYTTALAYASHAEGIHATVFTNASYGHAEGTWTNVSHQGAHAEGYYTQTGAQYQHVGGRYNIGRTDTLVEIGDGSGSNRHNAIDVFTDGRIGINSAMPTPYTFHINNSAASGTAVAWCNKIAKFYAKYSAMEGNPFEFSVTVRVGEGIQSLAFDNATAITSISLFDASTVKINALASSNYTYTEQRDGNNIVFTFTIAAAAVTAANATALNAVIESTSPGFGCVYAANTLSLTGTIVGQGIVEKIPGLSFSRNTLPGTDHLVQHVGDFYIPTGGPRWNVDVEVDPSTAYMAVCYLENTTTGAYFNHSICYAGVPSVTIAAPNTAPAPVAGKVISFIGTTYTPFVAGVAGVVDNTGTVTTKPRLRIQGNNSSGTPVAGNGMHMRLYRIY